MGGNGGRGGNGKDGGDGFSLSIWHKGFCASHPLPIPKRFVQVVGFLYLWQVPSSTPTLQNSVGDPRAWVTGGAVAGLLVGLCDLATLGRWLAQDLGDWFSLQLWTAAWVVASPVMLASAAGATLGVLSWSGAWGATALERRSNLLQRREGLAPALLMMPLLIPLAIYIVLRPSLVRQIGDGGALALGAPLAMVLFWLTWRVFRALPRLRGGMILSRGRRLSSAALLIAVGIGLFWIDAIAYRRLYAPLHWVLTLATFASFGGASSLLRAARTGVGEQTKTGRWIVFVAGPLLLICLFGVNKLVTRRTLMVRPMVHDLTVFQDKLLRLGELPRRVLRSAPRRAFPRTHHVPIGDQARRSAHLRTRLGLPPTARRPNIFVFSLDAVRARSVVLVDTQDKTVLMPRLRKLAAESIVFEQAYTPGPETLTTMGSWIKAPPSTQPGQSTLYEQLAKQGYQTACLIPWSYLGSFVGREKPGCDYITPAHSLRLLSRTLDEIIRRFSRQRPIFVHFHVMEAHDCREPQSYAKALRLMDAALGRWLVTLRRRGLLEEAVVIITADHGQSLGERGVWGHGSQLYNEQIHVPLLIWSSARQHTQVTQPTSLAWLGATIRTLAGASQSGPLLFDTRPVYSTYHNLAAIVVGKLKLIYDDQSRSLELYDLQADPKEQHNLVDRDPVMRRRLLRALEKASGKRLNL